ncbi:hypothetical protein IC582_011085 [Cucumis melo]
MVKIGSENVDCIFIGYASNSYAYGFLVHKSDISNIHVNTIMESRNATFFENVFPHKISCEARLQKCSFDVITSESQNRSNVELNKDEKLRRSKRMRISKSFGPDFLTYLLENEHQTFKEAMSSPKAPYWKEAVNSEIESIMHNHTWKPVDLPLGSKSLGCKWTFKRKMKTDGSVDKYKARLVAKGYKQQEGLDYFDTYSPVTRITSIHMLIAISALHGFEIHQMEVKTTFLNGELDE